jgi:hypothetical protein
MKEIAFIWHQKGPFILYSRDGWFFWQASPKSPKQGRSFRYPHKAMVWGCNQWWDPDHPLVPIDEQFVAPARVQVVDDGKVLTLRLYSVGGKMWHWFREDNKEPVLPYCHTNLVSAINQIYRIYNHNPIVAI